MGMNSNNANEKVNIMNALACSQDIWVLERYLEMALNESSGVRKQDGYRVIVGVSKNIIGRYVAWNWIRSSWAELSAYYDTAISSSVGRIITGVASDFNTRFELDEQQTKWLKELRQTLLGWINITKPLSTGFRQISNK